MHPPTVATVVAVHTRTFILQLSAFTSGGTTRLRSSIATDRESIRFTMLSLNDTVRDAIVLFIVLPSDPTSFAGIWFYTLP